MAFAKLRLPKTARDVLRRGNGLAGLILIVFNVILVIFAPYVAPHDPFEEQVAEDYAVPGWMLYVPGMENTPRNTFYVIRPNSWKADVERGIASAVRVAQNDNYVSLSYVADSDPNGRQGAIILAFEFTYAHAEPRSFLLRIPHNITVSGAGVQYRTVLSITDVDKGRVFTLADSFPPWRRANLSRWGDNALKISSRDIQVTLRAGLQALENLAKAVFSHPGLYKVEWKILINQFEGSSDGATVSLNVGSASLRIPGTAYGLLGTNKFGEDVWSQYVYGSRISLLVGLLSALIIVAIGLFLGVYAGYKGGAPDRATVFAADTVSQIPGIPLILLVLLFIGRGILWIIVIIALLSWAGLARQIRSWTMSLKERPFVEAARAAGASDWYLMYRVIAPQTIPILAVALALGVPGGIFAEAAVSILGLGDPDVVSWGKMINEAINQGGVARFAWWWVAPPIAGILTLAMGFALIGFTLDEILNPRLRRTR